MTHPPFAALAGQPQAGLAATETGVDLVQRRHQAVRLFNHVKQRRWHRGRIAEVQQQHASLPPAIPIAPNAIEDSQDGIGDNAGVARRALKCSGTRHRLLRGVLVEWVGPDEQLDRARHLSGMPNLLGHPFGKAHHGIVYLTLVADRFPEGPGAACRLARRWLVVERMAGNPAKLVNRFQADDTHALPNPAVLGASKVMGREDAALLQHRAPAPTNPPDIAHGRLAQCRLRPLWVMAEIKHAACLG